MASALSAQVDSVLRFAPRREIGRTGFVATAFGIGDLADAIAGKGACWWNPEDRSDAR